MPDPVTDPALLEVLNGAGRPVTDPALLEQLKKIQGSGAAMYMPGAGKSTEPLPTPGEMLKGMARSTAGGVPIAGPSLAHDLPAAVSAATGGEGTFGERFGANKAHGKEAQAEFERRFPKESAALGMAGGAAATLGGMAAAPALFGSTNLGTIGNIAMSGARGAGVGAADAYMRDQNPIAGGVVGGVVGGAAPGIARGFGAAAQGIGNLVGSGLPAELKGIDKRALEWAAKAAKADGLTDAQITAKFKELGPHGFLAEFGPNLREVAGFIAARPGTGKTDIYGGIEGRKGGTYDRIEQAFNEALGGRANTIKTAEDLIKQRGASAAPLYEKALGRKVAWNDRLQQFMDDPIVKSSFGKGVAIQRMESLAEGKPFRPTDYAITGFDQSGSPIVTGVPNMRTLNVAKKGLDEMVSSLKDPTTGRLTEFGRAVDGVRKSFVRELDGINPDYAAARKSWEGPTKVHNALNEGREALGRNLSADEVRAQIGDMNQSEREAYLIGLRGELARITDASSRGDTTARDLIRSRGAQQKIETLIGRDKTDKLFEAMDREAGFAGFEQDTIRNSKTAARSAVSEMMTPDPSKTLTSRARHMYNFHVTPGVVIPPAFERYAGERQAQKFEEARNALAPIVMRQGGDAERMARALIGYQPGGNISPSVMRIANALLQSATPAARQKLMEIVQ